ncbi:hypothetical protein Bpfe_009170 [Biomphalaria pfeifferi]|uniref:Uncharacterized protein n=1 Tax=Biomphalaria pfeifferi TaxID=112525 RepID=A0AAD8BUZ4_BIOPF|nr:hypothetical protein Bpfe_009170 [Biomphalaria pfeifferi]
MIHSRFATEGGHLFLHIFFLRNQDFYALHQISCKTAGNVSEQDQSDQSLKCIPCSRQLSSSTFTNYF